MRLPTTSRGLNVIINAWSYTEVRIIGLPNNTDQNNGQSEKMECYAMSKKQHPTPEGYE